MDLNKVILLGRLTTDPELRQTSSGKSTCDFSLAVNRMPNLNNETQADFIRCTAWNKTAETISKYFSKGRRIVIEGSLRSGSYDDKNHPDVKHYTQNVWVNNIYFCDSSNSNGNGANSSDSYSSGNYTTQSNNAANSGGFGANTADSLSDFEEVVSDSVLPF